MKTLASSTASLFCPVSTVSGFINFQETLHSQCFSIIPIYFMCCYIFKSIIVDEKLLLNLFYSIPAKQERIALFELSLFQSQRLIISLVHIITASAIYTER